MQIDLVYFCGCKDSQSQVMEVSSDTYSLGKLPQIMVNERLSAILNDQLKQFEKT